MPLRSEVLTKRWSTANLPILPFLAPRVFQPWPSSRGRSRRTHTSAEASQLEPKNVVPNYDNLPALGPKGQEEVLPVVVGGEGEARNSRIKNHRDNTRGFQSSKLAQDNNVLQAGGNGSVVWKPVATKPLRDIDHLPAGFEGENDHGEELLHAHDGTTTANAGNKPTVLDTAKQSHEIGHTAASFPEYDGHKEGLTHAYDETMNVDRRTAVWRRVGVPAAENYDAHDHHINPGSIREESYERTFGKNFQLNSWNLPKHSTTSERTNGNIVMDPPPKAPTEIRKFERDSYFYWRNLYKDLNAPTKRDAERARSKNKLRKDLTPYPFDRQRVNYLHYKDLTELWNDLIRFNTAECEVWWNELSSRTRLRLWPGLMLMALRQQRPSEAIKLLEITYTGVQPPAYAISDSLDYLVEHYLLKKHDPRHMDDFKDVNKATIALDLQRISVRWLNLQYGIRILQKTIWTLVTNLNDYQVRTFYDDLKRLSHHFFPNTLIHFASRFAKSNDSDAIEIAFGILKDLHGRIDFDNPAVMSLCTTILHRSSQTADTKSTVAAKFQVMISLGMKVNIITYNVLIHNAIRSGDSGTAWSMHEMMLENEIEPDEYTYSILLNDAKWRMDSAAIRAVMGHIQEKCIAGPYITTDLIHLIYLLHQNSAPASEEEEEAEKGDSIFVKRARCKEGFDKMLGKFREQFSSRALQTLIPNFSTRFTHSSDVVYNNPLVDPPAHTLVVLMTGLLQSLDSTATKEQYDHFLNLIKQKDKFALVLASDAHIWNVFLMALGRFHDHLSDCPKVIKTMMSLRDNSKEGLIRYNSKTNQISQLHSAEPDIYTWSILVHIFTKHQQHRAAEKVITAMQGRGTSPNEVTWTTLAYSYARSQDVEKMADTIHRLESTGVPMGERMVHAMTGIQDRESLMKALKRRKAEDSAARIDV